MTPCYKCEDRHQHCHAKCERYAKWDAERAELKAQKNKFNEANDFLITSILKTKGRKT